MKPIKIHSTIFILLILLLSITGCAAEIVPGALQSEKYLSLLAGKNVGVVVNPTSMVGNVHLVDFLLSKDIKVQKILAPEHGFRGEVEAGETVSHSTDSKSGLPVISLYGDNKKPSAQNLAGLDVVVYDIQDVGCRFFTYISTLFYVMVACAENHLPLLVLDRPNPNGDYVDGPVLKPEMKSFVGMLPIPVVYGCTAGELARMINGEGWLAGHVQCSLTVIPVENYSHSDRYSLPVKPSPNLPTDRSVRLYPSLCLFEATNVSIGRGTLFPFQVIGYPDPAFGSFRFTPVSIPGVSKNPLHENKICYGVDLRLPDEAPHFTLKYFIDFYSRVNNPEKFWNSKRWIGLLMGDPDFYDQINRGLSEEEIRKTWQPALTEYKILRKKYLLYPDPE